MKIKLAVKNKIIISLFLFPAVTACLIIFVIMAAAGDIKGMSDDIEAKRVDLEEKYLRGQNLKKLAENLKSVDEKINNLEEIFINKEDIILFATFLEEIAAKNGVEQKINLALEKSVQQSGYNKIPLQIFTEGKFNSQYNYLLDIEQSKYYINIISLELSSSPAPESFEDQGNPKIKMTILADTYWK